MLCKEIRDKTPFDNFSALYKCFARPASLKLANEIMRRINHAFFYNVFDISSKQLKKRLYSRKKNYICIYDKALVLSTKAFVFS